MRRLSFLLLCLAPGVALAQDATVPLDADTYRLIDRYAIRYGAAVPALHTALKPYGRTQVAQLAEAVAADSAGGQFSAADRFNLRWLRRDNWNNSRHPADVGAGYVRGIFYQRPTDLYSVQTPDSAFTLRVNPVLYVGYGSGTGTGTAGTNINTRGVQIEGTIDRRLGFYTFVADNQVFAPDYVDGRVRRDGVFPGEAFWKPFKNTRTSVGGYDFFSARGYLNYAVTRHISAQLGHDRVFIGNGYRSLILSDFAAPFFFLKLNTQVWKFRYQNLFTELTADYRSANQVFGKKYMAQHHLSLALTPNLSVGVSETVVFGKRTGGFELQYLNPVIFYRAIEQGIGSKDNALVAADVKWNVARRVQLYGQLVLDEFLLKEIRARRGWWSNKQAVQIGAKYVDVAGISNLDLHAEFNYIRPYTYQHQDSLTSYQHYQQPLAHPIGANLWEIIGVVRYQPAALPRLTVVGKAIYTDFGADSGRVNWGNNALLPYIPHPREFGNTVGQGLPIQQLHLDLTASYQVMHNLFVDVKQVIRRGSDYGGLTGALPGRAATQSVNLTSVALRWNIGQRLYEF
jgi:hypothetical protein